jgi:hypothetical protein
MKVAYGVVWRERGVEETPGRLAIGPHSITLSDLEDEHVVKRQLPFDEIAAVELRPSAGETQRPTIVFKVHGGAEIEIESPVDRWIVSDLAESAFVHGVGAGRGRQTILVSMKLRPGCGGAARELLRGGPPFDPSATSLSLHEAFLLEDEVLFLFETDALDELERVAQPDFWLSAAAWRDLVAGEVRLAQPAYSWIRDKPPSRRQWRAGLGF